MDKTIQLGLIGASGFGRAHLAAAAKCPGVTISAILSSRQSPIPDTVVYRRPESFFAHPGLDGVIIVVPNPEHVSLVNMAFKAGKHALVEKPLANTVAESKTLLQAAREHNLILAVGHNGRRFAHNREMKRLIDEGQLGQIVIAEGHFSHDGGLSVQPDQWRWSAKSCPGGPLNLLGIHEIDTIQYLLGPAKQIVGWQRSPATPSEIPDGTVTLLEMESGALAYIGASYVSPLARALRLFGTKGNVRWDEGGTLLFDAAGCAPQTVSLQPVDTLAEQLLDFATAIRSGTEPEVDGLTGLFNVAVMEAAIVSNQTGKIVTIEEMFTRVDARDLLEQFRANAKGKRHAS